MDSDEHDAISVRPSIARNSRSGKSSLKRRIDMNPYSELPEKAFPEAGPENEVKEELPPPPEQPLTLDPHQPPIIIGGGSLFIDVPQLMLIDEPEPTLGNSRPYVHDLKEADGGEVRAIASIRVLTESRLGGRRINFDSLAFDEADNCELRIWLSQLNEEGEFELINEAEPQIILAGNPFRLEIDKELRGPEPNFKFHSPQRYLHPGYKRHFHIERCQVFNRGAAQPRFEREGDDSYWLGIQFHDVH
jgi:hypothetical protein